MSLIWGQWAVLLRVDWILWQTSHDTPVPRAPQDASRFLRQLVRRRLASPEFLRSVGGQYARQRLPWPWQPSAELLASPMLSGDSNHATDSSVLLAGKSREPSRSLLVAL